MLALKLLFPLSLILNTAHAWSTRDSEPTLVRRIKVIRTNGTNEHLDKKFPGLIVSAGKVWQYLPKDPKEADIDRLAISPEQHFAPFMTERNVLFCGDYSMELGRVTGEMSTLNLLPDGNYTLKVYPRGEGLTGPTVAEHRLSFITPRDMRTRYHVTCFSYTPFNDVCAFRAPGEKLDVQACDIGKDCKDLRVYNHDRDPGYVFEAYKVAAHVFGFSSAALERMTEANRELQHATIPYGVYSAQWNDAHEEIRFKYGQAQEAMYQRMLLIAEFKAACDSRRFIEAVRKRGVVKIVYGPVRSDARAPAK